MSKHYNRQTWFDLTTGPSVDGNNKVVRYYVISCHRCGRQASYHATGLANDGLRKYFIRLKWEIGHTRTQHTCPDCINKPRLRVVETKPSPMGSNSNYDKLAIIWAACTEIEREKFLLYIADRQPIAADLKIIWRQITEEERAEFLLGLRMADGTPAFKRAEFNASTTEPESEEVVDAEPADWWKQLTSGVK